MNPRVFIPQSVRRFNAAKGITEAAHDFTGAMQHGQLTTILDDDDDPVYLSRYVPKIKKALSDFTHEDFLIAVGDPSLIALCSGIIARRQPTMTMLKWERSLRMYVKLEIRY
jgi:hypothetical protein